MAMACRGVGGTSPRIFSVSRVNVLYLKHLLSAPHPQADTATGVFSVLDAKNTASIHGLAHCRMDDEEPPLPGGRLLSLSINPRYSKEFVMPFATRGIVTVSQGKEIKEKPFATPASDAAKQVEIAKEERKMDLMNKGKDVEESDYWGIVPKTYKREDGSDWPWHSFRPSDTYTANLDIDLVKHYAPRTWGDTFALYLVKAMRFPTDVFFQKRYGCRAMMLETVAAVPGMVAGMLLHLKSLRRFQHTGGWIRALLEEAENERMHLMTFMEVSKPAWYERLLVLTVQGVFFNAYFFTYLLAPRVAHRVVGYLEEEAIYSYTEFLKEIDAGRIENVPAPSIAIDYWRLPKDARLRDVVMVVRADEAHHRDVNHFASNVMTSGKELKDNPAPTEYH